MIQCQEDSSSRSHSHSRHSSSLRTATSTATALAAALLGFILASVPAVHGAGIQSGPSRGNTYAGGMYYDPRNDVVYVTGSTYDSAFGDGEALGSVGSSSMGSSSHCFVASIDLDWAANEWQDAGVLLGSNSNLTLTSTTTCQAIGYLAPSTLIVAGDSTPGGLFYTDSSSASGSGSEEQAAPPMTGFAVLMDTVSSLTQTEASFALLPTAAAAGRVEYPQFLAVDQKSGTKAAVYAVSLTSIDTVDNTDSIVAAKPVPDYITQLKYGSSFEMTVRKWRVVEQDEFAGIPTGPMQIQQDWIQEFPLDPPSSDNGSSSKIPRVYVGGVIVKRGSTLIVAGSTRGMGTGYGDAVGSDEDGFLTLLDLSSGELYSDTSSSWFQKNTMRVGTSADDVVMGICDDPSDDNSFFIVGATQGILESDTISSSNVLQPPAQSLSGFVAKMDLTTLTMTWARQWGARVSVDDATTVTGAFAAGCAVFGQTVYVAGGVAKGARMINGKDLLESHGSDDLWVASLDTSQGTTLWMKQIGTDGSDRLSRHGAILTDIHGNAILYGDTTGSLYRTRDDASSTSSTSTTTDVFVMVLEQESGDHAILGQPATAPTDAPEAPQGGVAVPSTAPESSLKLAAFGIASLGLLVLAVCCVGMARHYERKRRVEAQKTSIFAYLQQFDVEDIDLRKSPPGGWHGTYLQKLAYGINKADTSTNSSGTTTGFARNINEELPEVLEDFSRYDSHQPKTYSFTHSSVANDSLFMESAATPSLGRRYRDDPDDDDDDDDDDDKSPTPNGLGGGGGGNGPRLYEKNRLSSTSSSKRPSLKPFI